MYDSTAETLKHSLRVGGLLLEIVTDAIKRATIHDVSKTEEPELSVFNEFTPRLKDSTYGSEEYKGFLTEMQVALKHHYAKNRHHPEHGEPGLEWRSIIGYEGHYEVNNYGDVRSETREIVRSGPTGNLVKQGKEMILSKTPKGYLRVALKKDNVQKSHMVHRLVATAFLGESNEGEQVNHINGVKNDNRLENLEWVSPSDNLQHAYDTGLRKPAIKYVVHCPELNITTFGTESMEKELKALGYKARSAGVWSAMDREGKHCGLTFEGTLLSEWRRSRISGMTLVDLMEMLADWKAATERHADGNLAISLEIQQGRFGYTDELKQILWNTADELGWL